VIDAEFAALGNLQEPCSWSPLRFHLPTQSESAEAGRDIGGRPKRLAPREILIAYRQGSEAGDL